MREERSGAAGAFRWPGYILVVVVVSLITGRAFAEKVLANVDGWQVFTDGRAGGFVSHAYGDGYPQATTGVDAMGNVVQIDVPQEGAGFRSISQQNQLMGDPGTINHTRLRSGFIGNTFGFGVRGPLTAYTTMSAYVQIWAFVENNNRQKGQPNLPDVRQGYAKLEGPWGSFAAGRMRALFSRGATDINVLYAHRWGVGWPGRLDNNGPGLGMLGFGVLGSGFSSAVMYATPVLAGFQLTVGLLDPVQLQGLGAWTRTKYPRPEAEMTFERVFANGSGKIVLFANGAYQKVYKDAYCASFVDAETGNVVPCEQTIAGAGYGGRLELGPFHLGVAGHYGKGLGLYYAVEASDAAQDHQGNLRTISGAYVQTQVVIRKVDLFAGWGIAQVYLTDYDNKHTEQDLRDPMNPSARIFPFSIIKYQMGMNAGIVFNATSNLHFDVDLFRAEAAWYGVNGFAGQKQVVWVGNGGMTVNW